MHVSAATKPVRVSAASNMAFKTAVWMAFARSVKKASSVALTSARTRLLTPTQRHLLSVRTPVPLSATYAYSCKCHQPRMANPSGNPQTELRSPPPVASHPRPFRRYRTTLLRKDFILIFIRHRRVSYHLGTRVNLRKAEPVARTTHLLWCRIFHWHRQASSPIMLLQSLQAHFHRLRMGHQQPLSIPRRRRGMLANLQKLKDRPMVPRQPEKSDLVQARAAKQSRRSKRLS